MNFESEKYTIERRVIQGGQISFNLIPEDDKKNNALNSPHRLIYVIKNDNDFLYVGEAKSALKTRITRGFTAYRYWKRNNAARNGYKGYKWIQLFDREKPKETIDQLNLYCFLFDETYTDSRGHIEAIEGELVYLIRKHTGEWPSYQNEIHFNNCFEAASGIAIKIFKEISE